jgi:hypothetical protein
MTRASPAAFVAFLLGVAFYAESRPEWPKSPERVDGWQTGMHWDERRHEYVVDWGQCANHCLIRGYPEQGDWSEAVTIDCVWWGICCEPDSMVVMGYDAYRPVECMPAESLSP